MANTLLLDLSLYLTNLGLVEGDGIDLFRDFAPNEPDELVVINEYAGKPVAAYESTVTNRSIQVLARSKNADAARSKLLDIFQSFISTSEDARIDFTEERWGQVSLRQTPFRLKQDEASRIYYCFNMGITTTFD